MSAVVPLLFLIMSEPNAVCWDIYNPVVVDPNSSMMELGSVTVYLDRAYRMPQDYLFLLSKRWGQTMPVAPKVIEGDRDMFVLRSPPRTKGTFEGFAVWAKFYEGGLVYVPPTPSPSTLEVLTIFAELIFMENDK